jgi:monooxygenase
MSETPSSLPPEQLDVLIVGAGLSGIGAAYWLQTRCPGKRYAIVEARAALGGTWDLFRYPGIRSDSDMYTFGYLFKPWTNPQAIADGPSIRAYIEETAREHGIDNHMRFGHQVVGAAWSSEQACWTVEIERRPTGQRIAIRARFLYVCTGYYHYDEAYRPQFAGESAYAGRIVQPQFWPADLDYAGKRVVIVGSGATAVTLVPAMAATAAHVTMLQRSPTYIISLPQRDRIAEALRRHLPARWAYGLTRWKNLLLGMLLYRVARSAPRWTRRRIVALAARQLAPGFDVDTHFTPRYNPWDQRLCVVPNGDLFRAIRHGAAAVVTGEIERFTPTGLRLKSGEELPADVVVLATGLQIKLFGGMQLTIDGRTCNPAELMAYKGMMLSDVPNLAFAFGYTNASWTLKADLTAAYVCRLLRYMDRRGYAVAVPRREPGVQPQPLVNFTSGYIRRAHDILPRQGSRRPWQVYQNYLQDMLTIRFGRVNDGVLRFDYKPAPP